MQGHGDGETRFLIAREGKGMVDGGSVCTHKSRCCGIQYSDGFKCR